jgi:DNA invertase Pin-like site-specific DNA recombinase
MKVGYARVSSIGQNLDSQIDILERVGCEKIFKEKKSGKKAFNREELAAALDFVREGDEFVVTRLDRCSRSVGDLHKIIDELKNKGVDFTCTEQPELNTNTSSGKLMIGILSSIAAFETDLRAERQADGIKAAQKRGVKFGRKSKMDDSQISSAISMQADGMTGKEIADFFSVGRSTLLRNIKEFKEWRN